METTLPIQAALSNVTDIYTLLNTSADWFYAFLLVLAVLGILYGAAVYITAGGDPEKLTQGRRIVIGALIGTTIAILSRSLIYLLRNIFA